MTVYDAILLGSSPNALVTAAYLAKAGKRVLLLEPSSHVGGVSATTEFAEGFKADLSLMSGKLDSKIINELNLFDHGLEIIERNTLTSLLPNGRSFTLPKNQDSAVDLIHNLSSKDASRYKEFLHLLDLASSLLYASYNMVPPQVDNPSLAEALDLKALTDQLYGYGRREMPEVLRLLVMPVRDFLNEWFESVELKGLLASVAIRGLTQGPFAGGTTFNLLHHLAIGDGYFRATAKGGVGAISQVLAKAATAFGAEIVLNTRVSKVLVNDFIATGVELETGEIIKASQVISDYDARYTFTKLVSPVDLEPEFNREVKRIFYKGSVARINLALSDLPDFAGISQEALKGTLVISPSLAYLEKAFDSCKYGVPASQPYIEISIPSLSDPTLAPSGKHVMSIWIQYIPYQSSISQEQVQKLAVTSLSEFAPNLESLILHSQVFTARDFEASFNLTEGHLYGSDMSLSQVFFLRPIPGFAQYTTPIAQLFLCGSATHPGGGIFGLSGRNLTKGIQM